MDQTLAAQVHALVGPILAEQRMELVELTCRPQGGQQLVRLLVDKIGGVTIRQCARVNQAVGQALEAANLIGASYMVEVSSPGLDRPLASKRDFERAIGEDVVVELSVGEGRTKQLQGMLLAVRHEAIVLKMPAGNMTAPFAEIRAAKKAIQW